MILANRGADSDRCAGPACNHLTTTILSAGATPLNHYRVELCDRCTELFFTELRKHWENQA